MKTYEIAILDFDRCIELMEALLIADKLIDKNDLAKAYFYRGFEYLSFPNPNYTAAISDYDRGIEIMEALLIVDNLIDENSLVKAYLNRGSAYCSMPIPDYTAAISDNNHGIEIMERLLITDRLFDENDRVALYSNRSIIHKNIGNIPDSINDSLIVLRILKRLFNSRPWVQKKYFDDLLELIILIAKSFNNNDVIEHWQNIFEEFIYPMESIQRTREAEETLLKILDVMGIKHYYEEEENE